MILEILQELEANPSRNFKIELLTKHKDNELLKEVCRLANDPFTQFYQRKIPEYRKMYGNVLIDLKSAVDNLSILSSRTLTGNAAIAQLQMILSSVTAEDALVIKRIIQKDLKCGVNTSTINKVWKNLIPEFPCMLCSPFEQKLVDKITFPAIVQCLSSDWMVETNNGTFTIQDIVENDLDVMVKSYNHTTDMVEFNKVLNKSKTFNSFNEWYRITLNDGTVTKPLTGNHLVWVDNKKDYIRVDELSIDDAVLSL